jgi:Cupin domain
LWLTFRLTTKHTLLYTFAIIMPRKTKKQNESRGQTKPQSRCKKPAEPHYLKPNKDIQIGVGKYLAAKRLKNKKSESDVALQAKNAGIAEIDEDKVKRLESGEFEINLGPLRDLLRKGYCMELEDVLKDYYDSPEGKDKLKLEFSETEVIRKFDQHVQYPFRPKHLDTKSSTPALTGGRNGHYYWSIPFRRLPQQNMVVEYYEFANRRATEDRAIPWHENEGIEIVYVIQGTLHFDIEEKIKDDDTHRHTEELKAGQLIHFRGDCRHSLGSAIGQSPALALVIRFFQPQSIGGPCSDVALKDGGTP